MRALFFILTGLFMIPMQSQDLTIPTFLEKWENSRDYLLAVAEAMPEEKFDFRPTDRQMEFKEQLLHIKSNMDWLATNYFGAEKASGNSNGRDTLSKAETLEILKIAFDRVSSVLQHTASSALSEEVDFFTGTKTKLQILNLLQDHVSHHRGQLIVYLNLNNIEPPKYVGW